MDFAGWRQQAIEEVRSKLREPLTPDSVLVHAYRCVEGREGALEHWLFAVLPDMEPAEARDAIAKDGREAWQANGIGADMDDSGWKALKQVCKGRTPKLDKLAQHAGKNLHALLGAETMAAFIEAAGSMTALSKLTQRDAMRLGNESGTFGGPQRKSLLERHELATNERALRVLASRAVLAARLDVFKGQFKGESLRQEVLYAQ